MEMSPEAKRKAEQELKELDEKKENDRGAATQQELSTTGLKPNVAVLLCYVGIWIAGIIFLVLEQKDRFVRFHAAQSIVIFGGLSIISLVIGSLPVTGRYLNIPVVIFFLILWILLIVKAYQEHWYRIPVAADLADLLERTTLSPGNKAEKSSGNYKETVKSAPVEVKKVGEVKTDATGPSWEKHDYLQGTRIGRTVLSCVSIFWSFVFLIFFNFYSQYIAYYHFTGTGKSAVWTREQVLTSAYFSWLPQMNIALISAIVGHIIIIIVDNYLVYEGVHIIINLFFAVAIGSLISIFPFDFSQISDAGVSGAMPSVLRLLLLIVVAILVISAIIRIVKVMASLIRNTV